MGLFVQASIGGRTAERVAVVPRQALQDGGRVLVVDDENRLRFRDVELLRVEGDEALISAGLRDGERVCISMIQAPIDGMSVRPVSPQPELPSAPESELPSTPETASRQESGA